MPDSAGAAVRLDGLMDQLATEPGCSAAMYSDGLPAVRHPELVAKLYDDMLRRGHSDLRQAERLARAADWLSERLGHEPSRAVGSRAFISFLRRRYPPAWERYQAALAIYQRLSMELEVGSTLIGALTILIYLGRYDEALQDAQKARSIFPSKTTSSGSRGLISTPRIFASGASYRRHRHQEFLRFVNEVEENLSAGLDVHLG